MAASTKYSLLVELVAEACVAGLPRRPSRAGSRGMRVQPVSRAGSRGMRGRPATREACENELGVGV